LDTDCHVTLPRGRVQRGDDITFWRRYERYFCAAKLFNTRHHSLAIAQGSRSRMHHLMMEFYSLDDVGQSYDIAQREDRVAVKFGRHPNDFMTSFYMRTPSEFLIEHGWGGREVGPDWQPEELKSVGSFWGHQGLFESLGEGPPPPDAPPMPAPDPNHAPLQVIDGNYERMSGVCPWWDAVKRSIRPV